ncbi:MAG: acyl-phosphate glycerol 3-phosphate acyltransferase [Gammaproteobacteria bacterium RIFCSPHIGHO2_12_FULL_41_15]|nr:MAG: acyl-phosphate glycerol 3-phosphate acyltransferase [Gammaproteobacteria bacterium RIFCSPHIGHO2_12_FULL_41_15]
MQEWSLGMYLLAAYLFGSINSAVIVCRLFALPNPFEAGSNNPGATNVLRLGGKKQAAIVLLFDMLKGLLPVILAKEYGLPLLSLSFIGLAAVLGHTYSLFYKFKGGKGVATALGVLLSINPAVGLLALSIWLLLAYFTHYSSLSSLVTLGLAPLYAAIFLQNFEVFPALFLIALVIFYKHSENIVRLMNGKESKIFR